MTLEISDVLSELSTALNPVAFAESLGITPDAWQKDVLLSSGIGNKRHVQVLASRQSGKSLTCALYGLWYALNNPHSLVLVLSPSLRQSSLLFKTILEMYKELGRPVPSNIESALTLQLANKSKIVSLPALEKTIRGYSGVDLLILDEAALVDDELYYSVRPMIAVSNGRIFAIGTPHGRRGWFYRSWIESEEYYKIKITADQCPRISKEWLMHERKALGDYWFLQEYFCEFHENIKSLFRMESIEAAIQDFDELEFDLDLDSEDLEAYEEPLIFDTDEAEEIEGLENINLGFDKGD